MIRMIFHPGCLVILRFSALLFFLPLVFLSAQERLYWDYPDPILRADGGRFPQILPVGDRLALVWQEFQGEPESEEASIAVRALFSDDGKEWNGSVLTVVENLPYLHLEEVPLFSVVTGKNDRLVVVVSSGDKGFFVYKQNEEEGENSFYRSAIIPPGEAAADINISPHLFISSDDVYRIFLTRRVALTGLVRETTLSIFSTTSLDAENWSDVELFIDGEQDRGIDGTILEQNFLPSYFQHEQEEYVVFQSLRQGNAGQVYQLYVKRRRMGFPWEAALPFTENLRSSQNPGTDPLLWDNQRPSLGLSAEGEILVSWERRQAQGLPNIAVAQMGSDGRPLSETVEIVSNDRYTSISSQVSVIQNQTWILWFDETGVRLARRDAAFNFRVQAASADTLSLGSDPGSVEFPQSVFYGNKTYILWQDRSGGLERSLLLRPDVEVEPPILSDANFLVGQPGRIRNTEVNWTAPQDSSGILSYSWIWSQDSSLLPSRAEDAQIYEGSRGSYRFSDEDEGLWFFKIIAQDQAGNWSKPLNLSYLFDITAPSPPIITIPSMDPYGYLSSNTFTVNWDDVGEESSYYRWRFDYLASSEEDFDFGTIDAVSITDARLPFLSSGTFESSENSVAWTNLDNGVWAFSVASIDQAGNEGLPTTKILLARQYQPVTFITRVEASKDELGRITLRIIGRGFSEGGLLTAAIVDQDGEEPWGYEYPLPSGQLTILSDRLAEIIGIEEIDAGDYLVGVQHPQRGVVFWNQTMRLDSIGNVKFGPFGLYKYQALWKDAARRFHLSANQLLLILLLFLALLALVITLFRFVTIIQENQKSTDNARAILGHSPLSSTLREEITMMMKKKGIGLRLKFTLALVLLVLITILIVTTLLGTVWIRLERNTLAEGLENESRLMVETLASSARNSIPSADRGDLLLLPDRITALSDARWTTVTGPRSELINGNLRSTSDGYGYVWASNDPDILDGIRLPDTLNSEAYRSSIAVATEEEINLLEKIYPGSDSDGFTLDSSQILDDNPTLTDLFRRAGVMSSRVGLGVSPLNDVLSEPIEILRQEVEQKAQDAGIARMIAELTILEQQYSAFAQEVALTLDFDNPAYIEAETAVAAQKKEIETLLLELSNEHFASFPSFNAEVLNATDTDIFVFYKPLLYRVGEQDINFFRGTIRLAVSVSEIKQALAAVQRRITFITIGASVAALALGILVALFISSLMLRPINTLVRGVSTIRDQPDMLQHESFDVSLRTRDELAGLADIINDMVRGLVNAAVANKELLAGQDIQKTFLPLTENDDGKKLSTGGASNPFFKLFGYYEGADAVSGDYFDFRKLDEDHYVMIKLDISGHGVTASLIMVQVASLFVDYFRKVRVRVEKGGKLLYNLKDFTVGINDLLNEVGFKGRFAAFNLSVINVRTAEYRMIHAGDNLVNIFDRKTRRIKQIELPEAPAAGQISTEDILLFNDKAMYRESKGKLQSGDIIFLYTDGIEESHHLLRDKDFQVISYNNLPKDTHERDKAFITEGYKSIREEEKYEEFDPKRVAEIIESALNKGKYTLNRRCDLTIGLPLHFDFSTLEGSNEDAVLALAAVEKIFRLVPDPQANSRDRVRVDRKVTDFLKQHFLEFEDYFKHPIVDDGQAAYVWFSHLKEDPQDDDLTIWAYERL